MYFILNVCYIPFIPLSSKSSAEEIEEMSFFHPSGRKSFLPEETQPWLVHLYNFKMKDNKQAITDTCQEAISEPGRAYTAPADVLCVTEVPRDSEASCSSSTSRTQEICTNDKCFLDLFLANRRIARNNTLKTECRNMKREIDNLNKILDRRDAAEARLKRQRKYKKKFINSEITIQKYDNDITLLGHIKIKFQT